MSGSEEDAAQPAPMEPWGAEHRWTYERVRQPVQAIAGEPNGRMVLLLRAGDVYVSDGARWALVLPPSQVSDEDEELDAEDLLLDAEVSIEDVLDGPESDGQGSEDTLDESAEPDLPDLDPVDMGLQLAEGDSDVSASRAGSGFVWVSADSSGEMLVSRNDGQWFSPDYGRRWEQLGALPLVHEMVELGDGEYLLATEEGLWTHRTGEGWDALGGDLAKTSILAVTEQDGVIYAATHEGLFTGTVGDGRWTRTSALELVGRDVRSVLADPSWEGGLWIATDMGIYRSDDHGSSVRLAGRNPLPDTVELVGLDSAGHLIAIGDGAWESVDGGVTWRSISIGLSGPDQWDGLRNGAGVWIAGEGGLASLGRPTAENIPSVEVSREGMPDVGVVVGRALGRSGLDMNPLSVQRSIRGALLAPHLTVNGSWQRDQTMDADFGALTNSRANDEAWEVSVSLCYGNCGTSSQGYLTDPYAQDTDLLTNAGDLDVAVVGNEVYVIENASSYSAVAANVSDRVSRYRRSVADAVTDLYFARVSLVYEQQAAAGRSIQEQVQLDLDIQEVTARLDAYTDGFFSRALVAR